MANLVLGASFDGLWPPDSLSGGTISIRLAGKMVYVSDQGFTITIKGTGFTYDDDGLPSSGVVTGIQIAKAGIIYATFTAISVDFVRYSNAVFGYDRDNGNHQNPDPYAIWQNALRGDDLITGSTGWDDLRGGIGNDTINAGGGGDYVADQEGNDLMDGGDDYDTLSYDEANYSWTSFQGVQLDALSGTAIDPWGFTDHFTNFENYKDTSYADTLKGSGRDEDFSINHGADLVDGRGGFDFIRFDDADSFGAKRGVKVNLATGVVVDSWKTTDSVVNIEGVIGSDFADKMTGSARDESFAAGKGIDSVDGGGGFDTYAFWNVGWDGTGHGVVIDLNAVLNVVDDGFGNSETMVGIEQITGSDFADRLTGNSADNVFYGRDDNDTILGGGGNDDMGGEWGRDNLAGGLGNDSIGGGGEDDTLTGNGGVDEFYFAWDLVDVGADRVTDFAAGETLWVGSRWGGGLVNQDLVANQFRSGVGVTTANSASQRFIYNTTTGDLYFDADGSGAGAAAIKFATLSNQFGLTFGDIQILL